MENSRRITASYIPEILSKIGDDKNINEKYETIVLAFIPYVYGRFNIDDKDENIEWLTNIMQHAGYDVTFDKNEDQFRIRRMG